jgi:membrane peptidoglycan carboxypeptidase
MFSIVQLVSSLLLGAIALAFTLSACVPSIADVWQARSTEAAAVDLSILEQTTKVYGANGEEIAELRAEIDRKYLPLSEMSPEIINAILSVEDDRFYEHSGINPTAIVRAAAINLSAGGIEQGGSTITQQLVKLGVVGDDQDLDRKIPEAAIAMRLEDQMSKDEILERYLNAVFFGGGAYGVQAAAELYFGKDASSLDYGESALLAGVISNPSEYDPVFKPSASRDRRNAALGRLVAEEFITEEEREIWAAEPLPRYRRIESLRLLDTYFVEEVKQRLLSDTRLGATYDERFNTIFYGGLEVHTTFDGVAQSLAENAMDAEFPENNLGIIGALVSVEPGTGAVRAMIGGPGFDEFKFNVTTQKGRPTGSSFKPFVLAAAFEYGGLIPTDQISARSPCTFDNPGGYPNPYEAGDYGGTRRDNAFTIRDHTLRSTNCGFLRLAQIVGLNNVVDTAKDLGLTQSNIEGVISLPLGPYDVTPMEMATAYATFANDGIRVDPHLITRVTQGDNVLIEHEPNPFRAVSSQTARLVTSLLHSNIRCESACTGRRARLENHPAAGKTGTGQSNYDAWFVGFTPQLATAVWIGGQEEQISMRYDRNSPDFTRADYVQAFGEFADSGVTGGSIPAIIWGRFMNNYMASLPVIDFIAPEPGRRTGQRLRLPSEEEEPEIVRVSPCGAVSAEVDQDDDGDVDWCRDQGGMAAQNGACPTLLAPRDTDGNGTVDRCVVRPRPEGTYDPNTTTTTTAPPEGATTTVPPEGATTTAPPEPPPTTVEPETTTTVAAETTTTTTAAP